MKTSPVIIIIIIVFYRSGTSDERLANHDEKTNKLFLLLQLDICYPRCLHGKFGSDQIDVA